VPAIWQMKRGLVDPFTERDEIVVEVAVVEKTQLDLHHSRSSCHPPWKTKEGCKTFPCGVRIGKRKIVVAGPHDHIHQRDLTDRHDLIFAIIYFIHLSFLGGQVLQRQSWSCLASIR
jgi:hypothetical protein